MEKPADTQYPIHDLLKRRWSPRAFADRPVEKQKLLCLLEAARWAASSFNEQPWRFVVVTREDGPAYEKAFNCLVEGNQGWAKLAPVLMLTFSKKTFTRGGKPNRVNVHDVALAIANLTVQATAMDLFVHQMAGIDLDKTRQAYNLPDDFEPVTAVALGYPGDPALLPEDLQKPEQAPRDRKPLSEIIFKDQWDKASDLVT